ncbi:MAG: class I SAM-dependent methyltransferase [Holophagales bacterium]|nr:class I SAM-dependent methyltransferase [Holophagales bacterium]MBK9968541.1 class I SAM-dependent methyltransferase [Holophagales bacterium]
MTFERDLYDEAYWKGLHPHHWFKNPPRKYAERDRDVLRVVNPRPEDLVVELGSARGDVTFLLARHAREVVGVDAAPEALALAEAARAELEIGNVRWLEADVADLGPVADGSVDAVAAIDLVEHIDDLTLVAMLAECRRVLRPGGRLGIYTPDRAHYVERMKAHDFVLKQFPQHIAVRRVAAYRRFLLEAGFAVELETWSVSPFPFVRWIERALSPLPIVGPTFRYRILIRAVRG